MFKTCRRLLRAFGCAILACAAPLAAAEAGSISGRVTDPQGAAVVGTAVTLYGRGGGPAVSVTTDGQGAYEFQRLAPGEYLVEVEAAGFARSGARPVRVERGATAALDVALELQGTRELVVVTSSGTPQTSDEVSKSVTLVSDRDIESRNELSIVDALRTVPGLRIQQQGGPGAFANIKTRGLRNEDTAVLIDGLRFRDIGAPQGDASGFLGDLLVTDIDRLEVLRGSGSSLYGSNAIGGVINIVTDEGGGRTRGSLLAEGGTLGLFRGRARLSGGSSGDRLSYSAGLAHLNVTEGVDGNDPARNVSGQGRVTFRLAPSTTLSFRAYGASTFAALNTGAQAIGTLPATGIVRAIPLALSELRRYESGTPVSQLVVGSASFIPSANNPDYRRDGRFISGAVTLAGHPSESFGYTLSYHALDTDRSFTDGPAGVSFQPFGGSTVTRNAGLTHTLNARVSLRSGRVHSVDAGYEFENERYRSVALPVRPTPDSTVDVTERSHALFVQDQLRLAGDRLQLSAAFRAQFFSLRRPSFAPAASSPYATQQFEAPPDAYTGDGSIAYFFRRSGTKLRGHVGNGYRAPSLYERFGTFFGSFGYSAYGDPRLRPDRSIAFDAGLDQTFARDRVRLSATGFYTRLQEVIIFDFSGIIQPGTDPFGRFGGYRNSGGALARGLELSVASSPARNLDLTAAYTFTNADQRVPQIAGIVRSLIIPDHQFAFVATRRFGTRLMVNLDMTFSSKYLAPVLDPRTFASRAFEFDGMANAGVVVSYRIPLGDVRAVRLHGKVDNLFNREYYESGFRTPRATGLGGLQFEF